MLLQQKLLSLATVTVVATMVAAGLPTAASDDACRATDALVTDGTRLCLGGDTILVAPGTIEEAFAGRHAPVTYVNYLVAGDWHTVVSRDDGRTWSAPLPAGDDVGLRTQALAHPSEESPFRLLQLATPMLPEWATLFEERGIEVHYYLPVNRFYVSIPEPAALEGLGFLLNVADVAPQAKLEPGIAGLSGDLDIHVLSVPSADGAFDTVAQALLALDTDARLDPEIERVRAVVPTARLLELAALPEVMWIDRAGDPEDDMDKIRQYTGADHIEGAGGYTGNGVTGIVMDSGLYNHPDFSPSFVGYCSASSPSSHGTNVYGIVFGSGAGSPDARGMAPDAKGVFAQYFQDSRYNTAACAKNNHGAVFHTNSWGSSVPKNNEYGSVSNENDRVVFDLDVLMLQSMSNCGPLCARQEAMAKNILSVGALYHFNDVDRTNDAWNGGGSKASTGPAADGRLKPELVGPYDAIRTQHLGSGYTNGFGGTSGATPVVAGSVALANEMARDGIFGGIAAGQTASPAAIKALLVSTAHTFNPDQAGGGTGSGTVTQRVLGLVNGGADAYGRNQQGWGTPDLQELYDARASVMVVDETVGLETGESASFAYTPTTGAGQMRVSLAWTDVPANPGADPTLVNDLDLTVADAATGVVLYQGNFGLTSLPLSVPIVGAGTPDRLNNLENVFVDQPLGGYTITVTAAAVNQDGDPSTPEIDQPFALVAVSVPESADLEALIESQL